MLFHKLKHRIRVTLGAYPHLFFPLARFEKEGGRGRAQVDKNTHLVIEGIPRSGNSFAVVAFQMVQPRPVRLAHHLLAPAQVLWGAQRDIPILVLVREPVAAASSLIIRHPYISLKMALHEYMRFYTAIAPCRNKVVVGLFDEVTNEFGAVIRRINQRFATGFAVFEHHATNVQKCFETIEQLNQQKNNGVVDELRIARPSHVRKKLKAEPHIEREVEKQRHLVAEARAVFHDFSRQAELERNGLMQEQF